MDRGATADVHRTFAERFEAGDRDAAVEHLLEEAPEPLTAVDDYFGVGRDGWYALVREAITGRCLDLAPGRGRHLGIVSALTDVVHAVEPDETAAGLLNARYGDDVVAVDATPPDLPAERDSFDTVLATGAALPGDVGDDAKWLYDLLDDDGSLVIELDGPTRAAGVTTLAGFESASDDRAPASIRRSTPRYYRRAFESAGFASVEFYALLPTGARFEWAVPLDDSGALEWVLQSVAGDSARARWLRRGALAANRLGLLPHCCPTYVAVCRPTATDRRESEASRVLRRGSNRAIVLEVADGTLESVRKVPNHPRNAGFNERALAAVSALRAAGGETAGALPRVRSEDSRLGPVVVEPPMTGTPIRETVDPAALRRDPERYDRVLAAGLEWIAAFQADHEGEERVLSPAEATAYTALERYGVEPPAVDRPLAFRRVPVHGDYHPGNLVVDERGVDRVIDWEYASLGGDPVTDPGFYALKLAEYTFGGFERGVDRTLLADTPHSQATYDRLGDFCARRSVSALACSRLLGHALVQQVAAHLDHRTPIRYHVTPREKAARLAHLYRHADAVRDRLRVGMDQALSPTETRRNNLATVADRSVDSE